MPRAGCRATANRNWETNAHSAYSLFARDSDSVWARVAPDAHLPSCFKKGVKASSGTADPVTVVSFIPYYQSQTMTYNTPLVGSS